jgi:hypothetical protein
MKRIKKVKSKPAKKPQVESQTSKAAYLMAQHLAGWAYDADLDLFASKVVLQRLNLEQLQRDRPHLTASIQQSGYTVIFDELEVGIGRHVYFLRSRAEDEAGALFEFRRRFFGDDPVFWKWALGGVTIYVGSYLPVYVQGFSTPPTVMEIHWPDTPN